MPYFFAAEEAGRVTISGPDARHLARSLRARPGEVVKVVDPRGRLLEVRLDHVTRDLVGGVVLSAVEQRTEPTLQVTVAVALMPHSALEAVLARCTELGAAGFLLVQAHRSVGRAARPERWSAICREAAMLAGRTSVPRVIGPQAFPAAWAQAIGPVLLNPDAPRRLTELQPGPKVTLFVGPEGGWTEGERALAGRDSTATLGPRNLRTETAALAGLAVVLAGVGDL